MAAPRILMSWHESPSYIPPPQLSPDQFVVGPQRSDEPPDVYPLIAPRAPYDLHEHLLVHGIDPAFDLVVVSVDSLLRNAPRNLSAFGCPLVFLAGDSHHMDAPLRTMLAYVRSEPFDLIVACHNRHHMHWFVAGGARQVAWLPGLIVRHIPVAVARQRQPQIVFVGQSGPLHPRRTRMLETLRGAGLPLRAGTAAREAAATLYAGSQVSFNASLNGDLNMRVFEVLSAGGCLLTDRLSPVSGLSQVLEEGSEFLAYGDGDELVAQAQALMADPARASAMAAAGHRRYMAELTPELQKKRLMGWIDGAPVEPLYAARDDPRMARDTVLGSLRGRVATYERIQEMHRLIERPVVDITTQPPLELMLDLADLPRLVMRIASDAVEAHVAAAQARALGARVEIASKVPR